MFNTHWIDGFFNGGRFNSIYSDVYTFSGLEPRQACSNGYINLTFLDQYTSFLPGDYILITLSSGVSSSFGGIAQVIAVDHQIDTITGAMPHYNMMDWFPLNRWIPYLLSGMIVGQHIDINKIKLLDSIPIINNDGILSIIGKNCLDLYTIHVVIFMILAYIKANKMYLFQE